MSTFKTIEIYNTICFNCGGSALGTTGFWQKYRYIPRTDGKIKSLHRYRYTFAIRKKRRGDRVHLYYNVLNDDRVTHPFSSSSYCLPQYIFAGQCICRAVFIGIVSRSGSTTAADAPAGGSAVIVRLALQ